MKVFFFSFFSFSFLLPPAALSLPFPLFLSLSARSALCEISAILGPARRMARTTAPARRSVGWLPLTLGTASSSPTATAFASVSPLWFQLLAPSLPSVDVVVVFPWRSSEKQEKTLQFGSWILIVSASTAIISRCCCCRLPHFGLPLAFYFFYLHWQQQQEEKIQKQETQSSAVGGRVVGGRRGEKEGDPPTRCPGHLLQRSGVRDASSSSSSCSRVVSVHHVLPPFLPSFTLRVQHCTIWHVDSTPLPFFFYTAESRAKGFVNVLP